MAGYTVVAFLVAASHSHRLTTARTFTARGRSRQTQAAAAQPSQGPLLRHGPGRGAWSVGGLCLAAACTRILRTRKAKQNDKLWANRAIRRRAEGSPPMSSHVSINTLTFAVTWSIYALSFLGYTIALALGPALLQRQIDLGAFASSFFLGQLVGNVALPPLARRLGIRRVLLWGLLIATAAWCFLGAALQMSNWHRLWILLLVRGVAGFGSGSVPVLKSFLVESLPDQHRAAILAYGEAATQVAFCFGPWLGGALVDSSAAGGGGGLHRPFYCVAFLSGCTAIVTSLGTTAFSKVQLPYAKEEASAGGRVAPEGAGGMAGGVASGSAREMESRWWQQRRALRSVGMALAFSLVRFSVNLFIPFLVLRRFALSASGLGAALALLSGSIGAFQVLAFKPIEGLLGVRQTFAAGVLCCSAALFALGSSSQWILLALSVYGVGLALGAAAVPGTVASSCQGRFRSYFLTLEAAVSSAARIIAPLAFSYLFSEPRALPDLAVFLAAAAPLLL